MQQNQFNSYQLHNLGILNSDLIVRLKTGDWRQTPAPILKCTRCGGRVTTFNLKFYKYNPAKVICWDCQKKKGGD